MSIPSNESFFLFDHIPLGICVLGPNMDVRFWNLCLEDWTGIRRQEVLGKPIDEHFPHLSEPKYIDRLQGVFAGGPPVIFSSQLHPHLIPAPLGNDRLRILHSVVTAVPRDEGLFDALFSIQDLTDASHRIDAYREMRDQALLEMQERQRAEEARRQLEAKIQQTQKLESLGVLAGGLAHDLNNLLVGILGNAELARQDLPQSSKIVGRLSQVLEAGRRAAELSNQMLAYSGKGRFFACPLDLSAEVEKMVRMLKIDLPKGVLLKIDLPDGLATIDADEAQIRQLINNLMANATDSFAGKKGLITVSTQQEVCDAESFAGCYLADMPAGPYISLTISDSGCGMAPDTVQKIFDPFFTTKFAGRGLGLAAALGIARGHRGTLRVDSELGRGTVVTVYFPASDRLLEEKTEELEVTQAWQGKGKILIIDDEAIVRQLASVTLSTSGLEVVTAENGPRGISLFAAGPQSIDLVILDLTMPGMDGVEVYQELRRIHPEARILLSSGYHERQAARLFTEDPPADFLKKPYQPSELITRVRRLLSQ